MYNSIIYIYMYIFTLIPKYVLNTIIVFVEGQQRANQTVYTESFGLCLNDRTSPALVFEIHERHRVSFREATLGLDHATLVNKDTRTHQHPSYLTGQRDLC